MKNKNGFTLFELLVSISIIAILTVIAMVSFSSAQKKARDAKRIQDVDAVGKALEGYYSDESEYPATVDLLVDDYIQQLPSAIKDTDVINYELINTTQACYCMTVEEVNRGNSTTETCAMGTGVTGPYYCRKGQQE